MGSLFSGWIPELETKTETEKEKLRLKIKEILKKELNTSIIVYTIKEG